MSHVEVRQIGHVAATPVVETLSLNGRSQTKALVTVMSNTRRKDLEGKVQEKTTSIRWTLWGQAALNASWYLDTGSKVAIAGTLETRRYANKEGREVFTFEFTARSVEYLESKAQAEARRNRRVVSPSERVTSPARNPAGKPVRSAASTKEA